MALALSSLRLPAPAAAASLRWVDACAAVLSGLCAVHCAVTPLLVGVLPAFAGDDAETGLRRALLAMGLFGVGLGTLLHRDRRALVPLGGALLLAVLLEVGAVLPAWEVFLALAISAFLVIAHALNTRACNARCHGCAPARFWTAQARALGNLELGPGMLALAAAILVHATLFAVILRVGPASAAPRVVPAATTVDVEMVVEPASALPEVERPEPAPSSTLAQVASPSPAAPKPAAVDEPSQGARPVSFGEVLTAHAPARFQTVIGSGAPDVQQAAHRGAAEVRSREASVVGAAPHTSGGGFADAASLRRPPQQPANLGARIQAHFPASARAQQVSGVGRTRLLVSAEGVVLRAVPLSEEPPAHGFAPACARALEGSRGWGEPLDASGRPVSTWIRFSCEFAIRH